MTKGSVAQLDADLLTLTAAMARIERLPDEQLTDSDIEEYTELAELK